MSLPMPTRLVVCDRVERGSLAMPRSDPHGHHDWHSRAYVDSWISRDVTRDEERRPLLRRLVGLIPHPVEAAIRALDVGAGYGALGAQLLERFPAANLVCQDFSEPMFAHARGRLADDAERVSYVKSDLMDASWTRDLGEPFDAVVSAIAIHNVRYPERIRAIYNEIAELVTPGGCFLNLDLVFGAADALETQLEWLRGSGLQRVQCFWQGGRSVIIGGFLDR